MIASDVTVKLEQVYNKLLNDNGIEKDISNIDSLGINISDHQKNFPFELKVYYQPRENIEKKENDPELIQFVYDKKMVKYRCIVKGTKLKRNYVVLNNQTYSNMKEFSKKIKKIFPNLQEDIGKIPTLIPEEETKYLPIHILGVKNNNKYGTAINMEWLLRDYLDDERKIYVYNDIYYKNYILNLKSPQFSELINFIQEMYGDVINLGKMHLWLMAIDYFPKYKSKYKVYLKIDGYNLSILHLVRTYFGSQYGFVLSNSIDEFIKQHLELKLYGFAICVDDEGKKSINMYFISREE
ncbi:hypothetical protein [Thomasclavelia sp.]|uniref:hypothetical protein n=1 Tax=Thomasclavelia sp. TaxID=3025757 RepID=UPI0025F7B876|nr:hypothetical protein [Thomasclavelia sp.]